MTFVGLDEVTKDILVMQELAVQITILSNVKFTNLILNINLFLFLIHVLHLGLLQLYQILGMFQHRCDITVASTIRQSFLKDSTYSITCYDNKRCTHFISNLVSKFRCFFLCNKFNIQQTLLLKGLIRFLLAMGKLFYTSFCVLLLSFHVST